MPLSIKKTKTINMSEYRRRRRRKKKIITAVEIAAAVVGLILILCAYAGHINPQKFFLAPFMTLAFIPMLAVVLIALAVFLLTRRWIASLILAIATLISFPIINRYIPLNTIDNAPPVPADTTVLLKVMTYNVLGFNFNEPNLSAKPSASMRLILDTNPDVVLLQEGGASGIEWKELPSITPYMQEITANYPYCYSSPDGLNIMSKYPFTTQPLGTTQEAHSPLGYNRDHRSHLARAYDLTLPSGKLVRLIDFRLQSYHLSFAKSENVRVSPDVKPSALERMRRSFALRGRNAEALREILDNSPKNVIMCGDMNDVSTSYVYRTICGDDMRDAWVDAGYGYAHTYNRHGLRYRIDHILYRGALRPVDAVRLEGGSSDHYPLMAVFDTDIK